jgi:hypothetical protein
MARMLFAFCPASVPKHLRLHSAGGRSKGENPPDLQTGECAVRISGGYFVELSMHPLPPPLCAKLRHTPRPFLMQGRLSTWGFTLKMHW